MFWIYGGSFTGGHGDTSLYGPNHLLGDDVVVVTFNYRIGYLGFLSTGDSVAPGNWGLKDAVEALRWVRNNIARFGGDPDNVTIFGESAGGVAVHYLVLSRLARGLYHQAISQSGSALNPWAYQPNPGRIAANLASTLGITYSSSQDLINQLRTVSFDDLIAVQTGWGAIEPPRGLHPFDIAPCSEPFPNGPVIIDHRTPFEYMQAGDWYDVPYITGYQSAESMFMQREHLLDDHVHAFFNANPWAWVPQMWNIPHGSAANTEIMQGFRNLYFGGAEPSRAWDEQWTWYHTDHQFIYGIDKTAIMHSRQSAPVYHYRFSYDGDLNLIKRALLLQFEGAIHADEIPYMFDVFFPDPVLPGNNARAVRSRLIRLWTNFAKYG
jgi:bile salt-stimulated lipase